MLQANARIISHIYLGCDIYKLVLEQEELCQTAQPGQFVHVRVASTNDPLLRRPISIHHIDKKQGFITLLYKVVGKGTLLLSLFKENQYIDVMGPLGNGFKMQGQRILLIGAGMGLAPLYALAENLSDREVTLLAGAQQCEGLVAYHEFSIICSEIHITTDDGSMGHKGRIGDLLPGLLNRRTPDIIYACGPKPVLRIVQQIALSHQIPCQLSLETYMGCGVGACLACTCASQEESYKKVCTDGPVFWAQEVNLSD